MTEDQAGNLIFKPPVLNQPHLFSTIKVQEPGKDISNVLRIEVPKNDKEIVDFNLKMD